MVTPYTFTLITEGHMATLCVSGTWVPIFSTLNYGHEDTARPTRNCFQIWKPCFSTWVDDRYLEGKSHRVLLHMIGLFCIQVLSWGHQPKSKPQQTHQPLKSAVNELHGLPGDELKCCRESPTLQASTLWRGIQTVGLLLGQSGGLYLSLVGTMKAECHQIWLEGKLSSQKHSVVSRS